jgi:hypothetical protein
MKTVIYNRTLGIDPPEANVELVGTEDHQDKFLRISSSFPC